MKRFTEYTVRLASVSSRRCASRPTKIVPSSATDTTDGTSASPLLSRMTTGRAVLYIGDQAIRGAQINADDSAHLSPRVLCSMPANRLWM